MRLNVSVDQNTAVTAVNSPVLAILTVPKNVCVEPSDFRSFQAHAHLSRQNGLANAGCASQKQIADGTHFRLELRNPRYPYHLAGSLIEGRTVEIAVEVHDPESARRQQVIYLPAEGVA